MKKSRKEGYNEEIGKSKSAAYKEGKCINAYAKQIDANKPCIVGVLDEPVYNDHWMVGEGYARYRGMTGRKSHEYYFLRVNDGHGSSRDKAVVYINYDYMDDIVYLK